MAKVFESNKSYCNKCGKELDMWDVQQGFSIHRHLGYGSKYDGDDLYIDLCCDCMDLLIDSCVIPPVDSLVNAE